MGYRERNRGKIEKIYHEYKDDVYKVCLFFLKDEDLAAEFAQQTFFKAYQHIDDTLIESIQGYLIRMARNLCFDYLKTKKREDREESWELLEGEDSAVISVEEIFLRKAERQQEVALGRDILTCLRMENENWYTALDLLFCLEKPHDVVADEMGISKDALYSLVYRARKWIRKNYMTQYNDIVK